MRNLGKELSIRSYAYIGDAVYEIFAREKTITITENPKKLHKATSSIVNAEFHAELLGFLDDFFTGEEKEIVRRARNLSVTTARRTNHTVHRLSTAFEAVIGYLYLNDRERLNAMYTRISPFVDERLTATH
jgi:ribonuclease-3 family protein